MNSLFGNTSIGLAHRSDFADRRILQPSMICLHNSVLDTANLVKNKSFLELGLNLDAFSKGIAHRPNILYNLISDLASLVEK